MADLSQQIAQLEAQLRGLNQQATGGRVDPATWRAAGGVNVGNQQRAQVFNQLERLRNQQRGGEAESERDRVARAREEMYGLARGDLESLRGDPMDALIREQLMERLQGDGPYDDTVRNAYFTTASDQAAGAEQAAMRRLQASGLSPGDPAYQAAMRQVQEQRGAANAAARLGVDMTADLANYQARGMNLDQANQVRGTQYGRDADASRRLQDLLMRETATVETPYQTPGFTTYSTNLGAQPAPAPPAPAPAPVPRTQPGGGLVVAPNQPGRMYNVGTGSLGQTSGSVATGGGRPAPSGGSTWTATGPAGTVTGQNRAPTVAGTPPGYFFDQYRRQGATPTWGW